MINKLKWFFGLLLVFFLILGTNLVDRKNFRQVRNSIITIYEDRLVAKDIIFELFAHVEEKNMALVIGDEQVYRQNKEGVNQAMEVLQDSFRQTKLTPKEKRVFTIFTQHMDELQALEKDFVGTTAENRSQVKLALQTKLIQLKDDLRELSKIQIDEGRRQMFIGKQAVESVEFLTRLEIIMLVVIALFIQIAVLYTPAKRE